MVDNTSLPNKPLDLEAHGAFVRALASHLLGGAEGSKDVAQEALLAAVQSEGTVRVPANSLRAWLSKIVTRKVYRNRKLERARSDREERFGREALDRRAVSSPEEESVRGETIRTVTEAVLALKEPYQQTVLLRFYEDKDAHQIAQIMGVPVATVRSRLQRAQKQLQSRLESDFGGSFEGLSLALLPLLTSRSSGLAPATAGAALIGKATMGFNAKAAVAGIGLVGILGFYAADFGGLTADEDAQTQEPSTDLGLTPLAAQTTDASNTSVQDIEVRNREALAQVDPVQPKGEVAAATPEAGLFGRVLYQGRPLAGVEVTQYFVEVHRLAEFRTGDDVIGRIRPIDREIRAGQWGYTTSHVKCVDPARDGALPEDVRTYKPVEKSPVVITDSDGRFTFDQFPNKPLSLNLRHAELDLALQSEPILPGSPERCNAGELSMQPAVTLIGNLTFDHALSLGGHTTTIEGLPGYSSTSDLEGRFSMGGIPPGEYVLGVQLGEGVYRPEWDQGFFLRLGKDPARRVTLATATRPCSLLSVHVTHNGEPFANESLILQVRGTDETCSIALDQDGRGSGTVPRDVALQPTARFGRYSDGVSIGEDLFISRREHAAEWDLQSGSLEVQIPYACIPAPETCLVRVRTDIEGATAVRFSQLFGADGIPAELDSLGSAQVRIPAWMTVEPCFQNSRGVWVHIETLDVMFPEGEAEFQMVWDKAKGGIALTGHDPELRKKAKKRAPQYRIQLQWAHPLTQEIETENRKIHTGRLAAPVGPFETILFPGMPIGPMSLSIHLQRKGRQWKTIQTWKKAVDVQLGGIAAKVSLSQ
ncbi:MAG: RNA polymerase sigma factor [Planctomycetota bacterium]|nr:RNA polymerase sigma factor [Planctomycetota bacterium]